MHGFLQALERVGRPRVLVVGDVMLDRYTWGNATRVSPEVPVLVLRSNLDEVRPGGAASVAYLLAGLEARVTVSGVIGGDASGRTLRRLLEEAHVDHSLVLEDACRVTTSKERIIGRSANHPHQLVRVDREDDRPITQELEDRLLAIILKRLQGLNAILISDYRKGVCSPRLLARLISAARRRRIPILVDPARDVDYARYRGATLLKPNRLEATIASGMEIRSSKDALTVGRLLCERSHVETVLLTLDAEGMALVPAGGKGKIFPTRSRAVHDVAGAGDMVLAMLGLCRAARIGWHDAAYLANVAAGVEVERFGVSAVTRDEIRNELRTAGQRRRGEIVSLEELLARLEEYRIAGRKIVLTNGCFDLLHVGHVRCLEEAAALGDVLIVAINSDESVRRLKGSSRPVVHQHDRALLISALACVSHVFIHDYDHPALLAELLRPDVLAKGGTYRKEQILGGSVVERHGGEVRVLGHVKGISTTRLMERIAHRTGAVEPASGVKD